MAPVSFDSVTKRFDAVEAVRELTLAAADGEFLVLVGPSGSGKTTALRMLAGLESITEGEIRIGERVINRVAPRERDIAMVFQDYALYPQMTVYDNLAFALRRRKAPRDEIDARVRRAAASIELEPLLGRKPRQLSGGQQQRVALGRALVRDPQVFLMDEPLSNLDAKLRVQTRGEIKKLQQEVGTTTVYVTHDQVEAMTMGDRIAVMNEGRLEQVGTPAELYEQPLNTFVAGFIGSPGMSFVPAERLGLEPADAVIGVRPEFGRLGIPLDRDHRPRFAEDGAVVLGIRPEAFEDVAFAPSGLPQIDVKVEVLEELGSDAFVFFAVEAEQVVVEDAMSDQAEDETTLLAAERDRTLFAARVDARTEARVGETLRLAIEPSRLYFFSPETGESLLNGAAAPAAL